MGIVHVGKSIDKSPAGAGSAKALLTPIVAGLAVLPYWILFGIDFFEDLHYRFYWLGFLLKGLLPVLGFLLKGLLPVVLSVNIIGLSRAVRQWARQSIRTRIQLSAIILHAAPILLFLLMLFWLFFLFRI